MTSPSDLTKQQQFVQRTLEERNIRFVRLWFTDVLGFLKSVAIAPAELENAFAEGIGFDGSAIEGFARVTESDMLAKPDPASFSILPWRTESPGAARMFCDISLPDGTPASVDPRRVLRQTLEKVAKLGYTCYTHPEIEFFLFKDEPKPGLEPVPVDSAGYFDHTPSVVGHDFRRQAITILEAMGISVEFSHHEGGPGQQEIDLRYADALTTADNIMTFRHVVKEVALDQGFYASFMPKPFTNQPGSAMHTHISLFEGERNAFYEEGAPIQLSKIGRSFTAGIAGVEGKYELQENLNPTPLPTDLAEAITAMEKSELVKRTLGDDVFEYVLRNKRAEWDEYRKQVSAYELSRYLPVL